jgi:tetratricopeptide (TPR) repeat protein
LLVHTKSIQAFLYSVMAGRSKREDDRPEFARNALTIGEELLRAASSTPEVRFDAFNARGIAWMRIGEANWDGFKTREECWNESQRSYDEALKIIPQLGQSPSNLAKLRMLQVAYGESENPRSLLKEAREYCSRSLSVNDQDQYPYLELGKIAVAEGTPLQP